MSKDLPAGAFNSTSSQAAPIAMQIHSYRRLQPNPLRRPRTLRNTRSSPPGWSPNCCGR